VSLSCVSLWVLPRFHLLLISFNSSYLSSLCSHYVPLIVSPHQRCTLHRQTRTLPISLHPTFPFLVMCRFGPGFRYRPSHRPCSFADRISWFGPPSPAKSRPLRPVPSYLVKYVHSSPLLITMSLKTEIILHAEYSLSSDGIPV
jgi:hypothetical protein